MQKQRNKMLAITLCVILLTGCGKTSIKTQNTTILSTETQLCEQPDTSASYNGYSFTLCFAGDFSLAEDAITTNNYEAAENGIVDCISPTLISHMQDADLCVLNNEFTYSTRGKALSGKAFTFRGNPAYVSVLKDLGVDLANLANNHVYDYGRDALIDTLDTLTDAGISYVGAGHNLEEAMQPYYFEADGKTVAIVSASRAEKHRYTPQATPDRPGILRCYDTKLFLEEIKNAKENADFVIAYVHWGKEYSTVLEQVQKRDARLFIDAGADAIIGAHPHCLQGIEYYNNAPIIYSLGNFWFNANTLSTMLLELHFIEDALGERIEVQIIPALQEGGKTYYVEDETKQADLYNDLISISVNVTIDSRGYVWEKPE